MRTCFFILLALNFISCATQSVDLRARFANDRQFKIIKVPFIAQPKYYCAPATLAMVLNFHNLNKSVDDVASMLYTPEMKGTFQNVLIAATRRLELIATPIDTLEKIIHSINDNVPVLIFQNLGLSWIPTWHYALVVGYDLNQEEMILHSGKYSFYRMKIATFEKTWKRVNQWGLSIVAPGNIPNTANEEDMVRATAGLELAGHLSSARKSYLKILEKWGNSLGAAIGLANIYYLKKDYKTALKYLENATANHPQSFAAWYNYSLLLIEIKHIAKAKVAANVAIDRADPTLKEHYRLMFAAEFSSVMAK